MDRTPIKIPGKNTRDSSKAAIEARKALNRPRGRPLKLTSSTEVSQISTALAESEKKSKKRSLKNIKSRRKMSNLEKLPTELLLEIFLHSMNIDLPRSSPVIGGKLTSELVYTRTIIVAFGPTWDAGYGNYILRQLTILNSDHPRYDYPLSGFTPEMAPQGRGMSDGVLQSAILRCRWASLSILQKGQEIWVDRHCKERPFTPLPFVVNRDIGVERELQKDRLESKFTPAKYFEEDFAAFSTYVQGQNRAPDVARHWATYIDVANGLEIPQSLLLGPWNEEMTRSLYWLVKGGAQFDWLNSTSGEAAMIGLRTAVIDGDLRVINLLFWAGLWERVDVEMMIWVLHNARGSGRERHLVVVEVLVLWLEKHEMDLHEQSLMEKALEEFKEQHVGEWDHDTIDFVQTLLLGEFRVDDGF